MKVQLVLLLVLLTSVCQPQSEPCNSCLSCGGPTTSLCKCDGYCSLYRDCCEFPVDLNTCQSYNAPIPNDVKLVCRSIFPDDTIEPLESEAFWMVSSCPSAWDISTSETAGIRDNCTALSSNLPPVTSTSTGVVYANEFCALCNGVTELQTWQVNIACTWYVYEQLELLDNNVTLLLEMDSKILQNQCQLCSFQAPANSTPRPCVLTVSECAHRAQLETITEQTWTDQEYSTTVDNCVHGSYDIVVSPTGTKYRNEQCAVCNGEKVDSCINNLGVRVNPLPQECLVPDPTTEPSTPKGLPTIGPTATTLPPKATEPATTEPVRVAGIPFTITLSNLGGGQVQVSVKSETVKVKVKCGDGEAALGLECRSTLCPAGYVETGGRCAFQGVGNFTNSTANCLGDLTVLNNSDYEVVNNETVLYNDLMLTIVAFDGSDHPMVCLFFFDCPSGKLPVSLNESEFVDLGNNTISYEGDLFHVIEYDALGRPIVCPPNETTIVRNETIYSYPGGYLVLTYIGCSLSVIGSALVLITYGIFKSLRTLPSLILMNVAATILANSLFIIIGGPVTQVFPSVQLCAAVAIFLHFFFLAQFSWMTIMSVQMVRTFYQATKLKYDSKRQKNIAFGVYFVIGWSIPAIITVASIIVDFTTDHLILYGVLTDGTIGSCWINHFESAIVTFIAPLVLSLIINLTLFVIVTGFICCAARSSVKLNKSRNIHFFRINIAIFSASGLTWMFGFIALLARTSWAWYPFIILNSMQGFVIFIAFLFTKNVLKLYWNMVCCRKPTDSTKTSTNHKKNSHSSATQMTMNV